MYSTVAPMMGLPLACQAQRLRAKECFSSTYMPGIIDWPFKIASEKHKPFHHYQLHFYGRTVKLRAL